MGGPVDGEECDAANENYHAGKQCENEPGGAFCGLWRGLGDPHGVDEGVRDEQEEVHILWLESSIQGIRSRWFGRL
jgi:hypothetical protein